MALINTGSESWSLEFEACEKLARDISEQLHGRDKELAGTREYDLISGRVRVRLKQFGNEVAQLRAKLQQPSILSTVTAEEKERRLRQVEQLQSRCMQLEGQFNRNKPTFGRSSVVVDMGTSGWGAYDDDEELAIGGNSSRPGASATPVQELRSQQAQMIRQQDEGLDELSRVISRQKNIASTIGYEVEEQNEIIEDISDNMDRVNTRMERGTDMIQSIDRKDSTCVYWVVILVLLFAILIVALV